MNTIIDNTLHNTLYMELLIKLVVAGSLSLIIGIERELKKKPVGLKTSLVIATFSCLLTIISIEQLTLRHLEMILILQWILFV